VSILLDALRKSERQQRKGSLPDIHAEDPPVEASGSDGSRAWVLWTLGAVVLLVLGVYGWRAWQAHQVPTAAPEFTGEPTLPEETQRADAATGDPRTESEATADAGSDAARAPAQSGSPAAAVPANPGPGLTRQPRSPVETLDTDSPLRTAQSPVQGAPGQTRPAATATPAPSAEASTASPAPDQRTDAQRRREAQLEALQRAVETTGVPEEERATPERAARPARAADDGAISFWQLPEMTRNSLPELRINVMVYDEDPSKRFIIMGGKRYGEGADIGGNLRLETVQRDRALFRHGAYLFYVKQ
jgi:general secretion pathway protein B